MLFFLLFWFNVLVIMLILLGFVIEDVVVGKDVYCVFVICVVLFVGVVFYVWVIVWVFECW